MASACVFQHPYVARLVLAHANHPTGTVRTTKMGGLELERFHAGLQRLQAVWYVGVRFVKESG